MPYVRVLMMCVLAAMVVHVALPAYASKVPRKSKEDIERMEERRLEAMIINLGSHNYIPFENAVRDFEKMGEEGVPHLIKLVRDDSKKDKLRINAIYTLGRLGPQARRAVPAIMSVLRSENADFKAVSVIALGKIGRAAKDSVSYVVQLLFDKDEWVARSARKTLLSIGTEPARKAVADFDELQAKKGKQK